jgi:hypothetical protein
VVWVVRIRANHQIAVFIPILRDRKGIIRHLIVRHQLVGGLGKIMGKLHRIAATVVLGVVARGSIEQIIRRILLIIITEARELPDKEITVERDIEPVIMEVVVGVELVELELAHLSTPTGGRVVRG